MTAKFSALAGLLLAASAGVAPASPTLGSSSPPVPAAAARSPRAAVPESFDFGQLGKVTVYRPAGTPTSVVLFISGDGGWNLGVVDMAQALADRGALVAGIDMTHLYRAFAASDQACVYPAADFEALAHALEARYGLVAYQYPLLAGYSSGATLAYVLLAQAPAGTFAGALSLGFCPDLEVTRPLCERELLRTRPRVRPPQGYELAPVARVPSPWIALHGAIDQVCNAEATAAFVQQVGAARLVVLPKVGHGYSVPKNWQPQYLAAFDELDAGARRASNPRTPPALDGLPIVEVPAAAGDRDELAVILTGDGGWAGLDREVAGALASRGIPVVGISSLQYFWQARTPEQTAGDVGRVLRHYLAAWRKSRAIVIGYSMGADVLPFVLNRLAPDVLGHVVSATAIAPGATANFAFHFSNWLGGGNDGLPLAPEIERLRPAFTCVYGADDTDSICRRLVNSRHRVIELPGGHHFGGDYEQLANAVVAGLDGSRP